MATIEKEKALDVVRQMVADGQVSQEVAEKYFPELKESEDIGEHLITYFESEYGKSSNARFAGIKVKNIIAWLEKKDKKKPEVKYVYTKFRIGDVIVEIKPNGYCQPVTVKYVGEESYSCESDDGKRFLSFPIISQDEYELVAKKIEQNPIDKVEPKFNVGDWLIRNDIVGVVCCIAQIHEPYYYLTNDNTFISFREEDKYRLWTIQDAKDGDVLVSSSGKPFIFKGFFDNDPMAYGGLVADDSFWPASNSNWTTVYCKPATKEQRNALMKAMVDAGYIFDFGKKELKKIDDVRTTGYWHVEDIEQNPAWSEEDETNLNWFEKYFRAATVIVGGKDIPQDKYLWFKNIKNRVQPKQEWSEEDEQNLNEALSYIKDDVLKEFIKSLRPQPKQEWNKDDECTYKSIIYSFKHNYPLNKIQQEFIRTLKDRVRPQNITVTDEELAQAKKDAYNDALDKIEYHSGEPTFDDGWSAAIWYLKKKNIRLQSQWKPSDEQMDALHYVTNFDYGGHKATLVSLYEQLKKLK